METRTLQVTLETAKEWYNSGDNTLQQLALQVFNEKELIPTYETIHTFEDAVNVLNLDIDEIYDVCECIEKISTASAAMFKLNIVFKIILY